MAEVSFGLLLTAAVGIVWSLRDNSNPATLWTWGWAIFAAMALLIRGMSEAAWAPQVSSIFSPLLPAFMLAGALAYANRPAPSWLLPAALAVGATRWLLVRAGLPDASHAVAIVAEPATHLAAAGVLLRATWGPGQKIAQRLLAPTLLAVAAVDTATGLAVARGGVYPPILTAAWAVASLVTLGIQITASGHRGRQLRGALERESDRAREALEASKRRFETLAEYVTDLIMEIDSSGRIAYLSPSARHILGLEVADALGSASLDLVHPDDRARAGEVLQRALSDAYSSEVILRTRHAEGSWRWMESNIRSFRDERGEPRIVVVSRDVTERHAQQELLQRSHDTLEQRVEDRTVELRRAVEELEREVAARRRAEQELRASRERYRIVSELSSDYSFSFTVDSKDTLRAEWITDAFTKITGYGFGELSPADWRKLVEPEYLQTLESVIPRLRRGEIVDTEGKLITKSGRRICVHSRIAGIPGSDGGLRIVGASQDVTERIEAAEERRKLEAHLSDVQRRESLGVLAGGIAHDFNNMLHMILGNTRLGMADVPADSPVGRRFARIQTAAEHGAALTEQMLTYSGRTPSSRTPVDLSKVVADTSDLLEASLSDKGRLEIELGDDLPAVNGDETQLRQVVINLVTNAAESLGDEDGRVFVRTGRRRLRESDLTRSIGYGEAKPGDCVVLEVEDTGVGIDETSRERIFDPFFTTRRSGRGLGLAAVLGIVKGHEGVVLIDSEPARGTRFSVCLPASENQVSTASTNEREGVTARDEEMTVLLVDDDDGVLEVGAEFLKRAGLSVLTAASGREALAIVEEHGKNVDVVVLDLVMPELGGEQTLRDLRRILPHVPVILTSGYDEERSCQRFGPGEIASFVRKPYGAEELVSRVLAAIG